VFIQIYKKKKNLFAHISFQVKIGLNDGDGER